MGTDVGLQLVSLLVKDYDDAINFYVNKLGFDLVEDSPAVSGKGNQKRWVVVRPPGNPQGCAILLARADGPEQSAVLTRQFGGRVGLFWRVADFDDTYSKLQKAGVELCEEPRLEAYGQVVVFKDLVGNKWDLLGRVTQVAEEVAEELHIV